MELKHFFYPESVAVVGASSKKGKVGYEILAALKAGGFKGEIYPINPNHQQIQSLKTYPDLLSIGSAPDLVVIAVGAKNVEKVMEQCASLKVPAVVIVSSGFKEESPQGAELEKNIKRIARRAGIRIIGPNCLGLMCTSSKLNASFGGALPKKGKIGYFSQSGSILAAIMDMASVTDIGFSKLISMGNKADVNELDLIRSLGEDSETQVIAGYLESFVDGDAFIRQAEKVSKNKPILLLKSGFTEAGARAATSHTGRLAGVESAYDCVFERAGVIRCNSIKHQFDFARAFAYDPCPAGPRVAVIANAGGAGIMATDAIEREGLELAEFSEQTRELLKNSKVMTRVANISNPIDLLGDALADRFEFAIRTVMDDPNVDTVLVLLSPHATTDCNGTAEAVVRVAKEKMDKPVLACFLGANRIREAAAILSKGRVPQYDSPEAAVRTIRAMSNYSAWRNRPKRVVKLFPVNRRKVEGLIEKNLRKGMLEIGEMQTKEILQAYGFVIPRGDVATSPEQAVSIANQIGYPVVLKLWSPDIIHKTEVEGVKTNLYSDQVVRDAFDLMMYRIPRKRPGANIIGILVEEMCNQGKEVILGMNRDPRFGPLMMFGMGGKLVEVLEDVVFYPAPLTADEAKEMLISTRTYELLTGARGEEGVDVGVIAEGLQRLSQLSTEFPQIKEVEINPYIVGRQGMTPVAVDAMMTLEEK